MFLKEDYGDRALGLVGALAVLITGIVVTGSLDAAPAPISQRDAPSAVNSTPASLAPPSGQTIPVC